MLDVRDHELLMLLLMMDAEYQNRLEFCEQVIVCAREQRVDVGIDRSTIASCLVHGRPRNEPPQGPPVHVARGVVVGVEEKSILRDLRLITRHPAFHDEGLEKPRRM